MQGVRVYAVLKKVPVRSGMQNWQDLSTAQDASAFFKPESSQGVSGREPRNAAELTSLPAI